MRKYLMFTLLLLLGCTRNATVTDCKLDFEFKSNFQNCVNLFAIRQLGVYVDLEDSWNAYYCLEALTKHHSLLDVNSDMPLFYPSAPDSVNYFCQDLEAWMDWYEKNKCSINMQTANSILNSDSIKWPKFAEELRTMDCVVQILKE